MSKPDANRSRPGDTTFLAIFFGVIFLSLAANITLDSLRPRFSTQQQEDEIDQPIRDNRWIDFGVPYPDFYYLDLTFDAETPLTFAVIDENEQVIYSAEGTSFQEENIRLKLSRGHYWFSMSCDSGFTLNCSLE